MNLLEAPMDVELKIVELGTCSESKRKLNALGMHINDHLTRLNNNKWGPILVRNISGGVNKIAICRGLASKIIVSE